MTYDHMEKYKKLKEDISRYQNVTVAFSGGVDSSLLLYAAKDALGSGNILAVTAAGDFFPIHETGKTKLFCAEMSIKHLLININAADILGFKKNEEDRCYLCKKHIMQALLAETEGVLVEGSNTDDADDYRPGSRAIAELGISSPLKEAGLCKSDIRSISKDLGLPTWNDPSCACLASRIPFGSPIQENILKMIDKSESIIRESGFKQVRVRVHENSNGLLASIEVGKDEIDKLNKRSGIINSILKQGFDSVVIDREGYITGKLNPRQHI